MSESTESNNSEQQRQQRWLALLARMDPSARQQLLHRAALSKESEEHSDFQKFKLRLPPEMSQALLDQVTRPQEDWPNGRRPMFFLIEHPDGESPRLIKHPDLMSVLKRMQELDGTDVHAFPVYGHILQFSISPKRVLVAQDESAFQFTPEIVQVDRIDTELDLQTDYFMGPPALTITLPESPETSGGDAFIDQLPAPVSSSGNN